MESQDTASLILSLACIGVFVVITVGPFILARQHSRKLRRSGWTEEEVHRFWWGPRDYSRQPGQQQQEDDAFWDAIAVMDMLDDDDY